MNYLKELQIVFEQSKKAKKELKRFVLRELRKETKECKKILVRQRRVPIRVTLEYSKFLEEIDKECERMKEWKQRGM